MFMPSPGVTSMIKWFTNKSDYISYTSTLKPLREVAESHISKQTHIKGYCWVCSSITNMLVNGGALFGSTPNLREGLLCEQCGLSNRCRLMYNIIKQDYVHDHPNHTNVLVLESLSPFYSSLTKLFPKISGSEFVSPESTPGSRYTLHNGISVRHESITNLSCRDAELDLLIHNDVLEHVFDYKLAFYECHRVLKYGGSMYFTCPFFSSLDEPLVRALITSEGDIQHLEPPELHGDPLNSEGILAFYHHGWNLLDELRNTGFHDVAVGLDYDVFCGFVSNNFPTDSYGLMYPLVIRANKSI